MTTAVTATLTEAELFARYLDAHVRVEATASYLVADDGVMFDTTARDRFFFSDCAEFLPDGFADNVLQLAEESDQPSLDMEKLILSIGGLLNSLKTTKHDFDRLADVTRTDPPMDTGDAEADETADMEWEDNPRFVLPVIDQKDFA